MAQQWPCGPLKRHHPACPQRQQGVTLVELMIGLALSLMVTLAATAALVASRQGFAAVDAASMLRDNGRLASMLMQRVVAQAGYRDHSDEGAAATGTQRTSATWTQPFIEGFDDRAITVGRNGPQLDTGIGRGLFGSDVLIVRFQGASTAGIDASDPTRADGTMIDCAGSAQPGTAGTLAHSVFYVARSSGGEPALMCGHRDGETGQWVAAPLVSGVESLQVRYGVDTPDAPPGAPTTDRPQVYLSATDLQDHAEPAQRLARWQRVKAVRIGLVLRAAPGSAIDRGPQAARTIYPLGVAMHDTSDPGTEHTVAPDGRLREVVTFTVHLRNPQTW